MNKRHNSNISPFQWTQNEYKEQKYIDLAKKCCWPSFIINQKY